MKTYSALSVIFISLLFGSAPAFSQISYPKDFPFYRNALEKFATYEDSLLPVFREGTFSYVHRQTLKNAFSHPFEVAYPFVGKTALVKENGKYGIIDRKGSFILKPVYNAFSFPPYENYLVLLHGSNGSKITIFNLCTGKTEEAYIICEKSAVPGLSVFINEAGKYGLKDRQNTVIVPTVYDSILFIHFNYVIAKLNSKIGIIDYKNQVVLPFEYEELIYSRGQDNAWPGLIGLKKNTTWYYFDRPTVNNKPVTETTISCIKLGGLSDRKALGIFKEHNRYNILFRDGSTLAKDYEEISDNGKLARDEHGIYLLTNDRTEFLYYPILKK